MSRALVQALLMLAGTACFRHHIVADDASVSDAEPTDVSVDTNDSGMPCSVSCGAPAVIADESVDGMLAVLDSVVVDDELFILSVHTGTRPRPEGTVEYGMSRIDLASGRFRSGRNRIETHDTLVAGGALIESADGVTSAVLVTAIEDPSEVRAVTTQWARESLEPTELTREELPIPVTPCDCVRSGGAFTHGDRAVVAAADDATLQLMLVEPGVPPRAQPPIDTPRGRAAPPLGGIFLTDSSVVVVGGGDDGSRRGAHPAFVSFAPLDAATPSSTELLIGASTDGVPRTGRTGDGYLITRFVAELGGVAIWDYDTERRMRAQHLVATRDRLAPQALLAESVGETTWLAWAERALRGGAAVHLLPPGVTESCETVESHPPIEVPFGLRNPRGIANGSMTLAIDDGNALVVLLDVVEWRLVVLEVASCL